MREMTRVALVTSGGDCQGLNAAIRGTGKALYNLIDNVEVFGMYDGYRGLIDCDYKFMQADDFLGILTEGGTILGTSRQKYIPRQFAQQDICCRAHGAGCRFTIVACAEGAVSKNDKLLDEEECRKIKESSLYPTVSYRIAAELEKLTGQTTRVTVPGHYQRGGPPCPYDRVLATQFGEKAAEMIINKEYNRMVAIQNGSICSIPLEDIRSHRTPAAVPDPWIV